MDFGLGFGLGGGGASGIPARKVVVFGHSFIDREDATRRFAALMGGTTEFIDQGIGGDRYDQMDTRFATDVTPYHPDVVILSSPINDINQGRTVEQIDTSFDSIKAKCDAIGATLITSELPPGSWTSIPQAKLVEWNGTNLPSKGVAYVKCYDILEDPANAGAILPAYAYDNIHINAAGYDVWCPLFTTLLTGLFSLSEGIAVRYTFPGGPQDGTPTGAPVLAPDRNFIDDRAYTFASATSDKITIPAIDISGGSPFTIMCDIRPTQLTSPATIFSGGKEATSAFLDGIVMIMNSGAAGDGDVLFNFLGRTFFTTDILLKLNEWNTVEFKYYGGEVTDAGACEMFINNLPCTLDTGGVETGTPDITVENFMIGADTYADRSFTGQIAEINVWKRAINRMESCAEYARITGWTMFDTFTSHVATVEELPEHQIDWGNGFPPYIDSTGATNSWKLEPDGTIHATYVSGTAHRAFIDLPSRDGTIELYLSWPSTATVDSGILFRHEDTDNASYVVFSDTTASLEEGIEGSFDVKDSLTGLSYTPGDMIHCRIDINGSTITVTLDKDPTKQLTWTGFEAGNVATTFAYWSKHTSRLFADFSYRPDVLYGPELSVNGDFGADTDWTKDGTWSIAAGVASATTESGDIEQDILVNGRTYLITYTVTAISAGTIQAKAGGGSGAVRSTVGTFSDKVLSSGGLLKLRGAGFTGSIDNISCKQVL